jgi:hypothetical protein
MQKEALALIILLLAPAVLAVVGHDATVIRPGTFSTGNYVFPQNVTVTNNAIINGNVGIGTTSPSSRLDVNGDVNIVDGGYIRSNGVALIAGSNATKKLYIGTTDPANPYSISFDAGSGGSGRMFINATTGYVGIGTTNPTNLVHIGIPSGSGGGVTVAEGSNMAADMGDGSSTGQTGILRLYEQGVEKVRLYAYSGVGGQSFFNAGKVGIGTTNPDAKLEINGTGMQIKLTGANYNAGLYTSGNVLYLDNWNDAKGITVDLSTGYTGINAYPTTPTQALQVHGNIWANGGQVAQSQMPAYTPGYVCQSGGWIGSCSSDGRLKKNINYVSEPVLDRFMQLKPATFTWRNDTTTTVGFIAQDVKAVFPLIVQHNTTDGYLEFSESYLMPYAVKSIQELNQKVSQLSSQNDDLKSELCKKDQSYSWC